LDHTNYYLKPFNVLLCICASRLAARYLIGQFVQDDIERTLLFQWSIEINLKFYKM